MFVACRSLLVFLCARLSLWRNRLTSQMDVCTRVELMLKPQVTRDIQKIRIRCNVMGHDDFYVSFVDYVAALVSGIDVPISVEMNDDRAQVHNGFPPHHGRRAEWLRALSYVSAGTNSRAARLIDPLVTRLREIRHNNVCYGLAAISTVRAGLCDFLSAKSVGGLTVRDGNPTHDGFVGVIDYLPNSAKREPGEIAAPRGAIEAWLLEQVDLLEDGDLSAFDSVLASYSLCGFDYDPINVLQGVAGYKFIRTRFLATAGSIQ